MEFVIEANLSRRHLNSFQKAEIGLKLLEIEKEKAKKRMLAGKHPVPSEGTGRSIEIVADKLHISKNTVEKVKEIIEKGDEELIEKCRQGEVSVLEAYKKIKNEEKELDDSR
jgi:transposase